MNILAECVYVIMNHSIFMVITATNLFIKKSLKAVDSCNIMLSEASNNEVIIIPSREKIVSVSKFIRNLPKGQKASYEKLNEAIKNGFELGAHQTWVDDYSKVCA